ncbi:MAG: hypothetical protein AAGA48_01510 [Myxococcota bacterium]
MRAEIHHAGEYAWSVHEVAAGLCVTNRFGADKVASVVALFEETAAVAHLMEEERLAEGVRIDRTSAKGEAGPLPKLTKPPYKLVAGIWKVGPWRLEARDDAAIVSSHDLPIAFEFRFGSNGWFNVYPYPRKAGTTDITIYNRDLCPQLQSAMAKARGGTK